MFSCSVFTLNIIIRNRSNGRLFSDATVENPARTHIFFCFFFSLYSFSICTQNSFDILLPCTLSWMCIRWKSHIFPSSPVATMFALHFSIQASNCVMSTNTTTCKYAVALRKTTHIILIYKISEAFECDACISNGRKKKKCCMNRLIQCNVSI